MSRKEAHGKPCPYCQRQMDLRSFHLEPTRDHVIPQSKGGRKTIICCRLCNSIKADMLPSQWEAYMAANPGWWLLTRAERRARARAPREAVREAKYGPRKPQRQGSPPAKPVVVPPELIWVWVPGKTPARVRINTPAEPEPQPSRSDEACPP
ncbi:HNH endonuclease [Bradyrhizobium sp.]